MLLLLAALITLTISYFTSGSCFILINYIQLKIILQKYVDRVFLCAFLYEENVRYFPRDEMLQATSARDRNVLINPTKHNNDAVGIL